MQKYIWDEKYNVGIKEIDEQHQHFYELVNEIIDMVEKENVSLSDLMFRITSLSNYAVYHFLTEEKFFKRDKFPDETEHINAHNVFREQVKQFISEAEKENIDRKDLAQKIAKFSGDWLTNDMLTLGQKYADFLRKGKVS